MGAAVAWRGELPSPPPVFKGGQATTSQGKWLAQDISYDTPSPTYEALTPRGKRPPQRGSRKNAGLSQGAPIPQNALWCELPVTGLGVGASA